MLGLGEEKDEVLATLRDLAAQGADLLTLGQYLQPTRDHLPIVRYVHPDEFGEFKVRGEAMGFKHVEAGPLVRSSYHAFEQTESANQGLAGLNSPTPNCPSEKPISSARPSFVVRLD